MEQAKKAKTKLELINKLIAKYADDDDQDENVVAIHRSLRCGYRNCTRTFGNLRGLSIHLGKVHGLSPAAKQKYLEVG
jgi:hypothetical protein